MLLERRDEQRSAPLEGHRAAVGGHGGNRLRISGRCCCEQASLFARIDRHNRESVRIRRSRGIDDEKRAAVWEPRQIRRTDIICADVDFRQLALGAAKRSKDSSSLLPGTGRRKTQSSFDPAIMGFDVHGRVGRQLQCLT